MSSRVFALISLFVTACSEPGDGDTADGGASTDGAGGTQSGTGGAAAGSAPVPKGPGRDASVVDACENVVCDGTRIGSWELIQRCDESGTWVDAACPAARYAWSVQNSVGDVLFNDGNSEWELTMILDWTIDVPNSCGGCDVEAELSPSMTTLTCSPEGGACRCTGTATYTQDWVGRVFAAAGDGHWNFTELTTAELVAAGEQPPQHEFWTCAGKDEMTIFDENGARLRFSRVE